MTALSRDLLPDLPGVVHGIKSLNPAVIQCDGCAKTHTDERVSWAVIQSGIVFNPRAHDCEGDRRRMCNACWEQAGWVEDYSGWKSTR